MIANYISGHLRDGRYIGQGKQSYRSINGWLDFCSVPHLIFSHRRNDYRQMPFYDHIHVHDFYEIVFHITGDVEYVSGGLVNKPYSGNIIINRPGEDHTTRLVSAGIYERYVFYFDREFLSFFEGMLPICGFFDSLESFAIKADAKHESAIRSMLSEIEDSFEKDESTSPMLAYSRVLALFYLLEGSTSSAETEDIPRSVLMIKSYIDSNAPSIKDVNAVAEAFFYSREHVSRTFRKYFNTNVSDYLAFRKAEAGRELLQKQKKVTDVASECGFGSTPAFVRAFRKTYKSTPQEYLRQKKEEKPQ